MATRRGKNHEKRTTRKSPVSAAVNSARDLRRFDIATDSIDDLSEKIANVYRKVTLLHHPLARWMQILTDITILAEDTRRGKEADAIQRAFKVLMRIFEFVGHYTHLDLSELPEDVHWLAKRMRARSRDEYFGGGGPREGLTRWILAKYPYACAKCGASRCECVLKPDVFEERREEKGLAAYRKLSTFAKNQRLALADRSTHKELTLPGMFEFFRVIYGHNTYGRETWQTAMHLVEESGEATTELSRIDMFNRALSPSWRQVLTDVASALPKHKELSPSEARAAARAARRLMKEDAATSLADSATDKFKEEIADIMSWTSALLYQLMRKRHKLAKDTFTADAVRQEIQKQTGEESKKGYLTFVAKESSHLLFCPFCEEPQCADKCLLHNATASEIKDDVTHV